MAMGGFALNYFSYRTRSSALACASVAPASSISTCTGAAMSGMLAKIASALGVAVVPPGSHLADPSDRPDQGAEANYAPFGRMDGSNLREQAEAEGARALSLFVDAAKSIFCSKTGHICIWGIVDTCSKLCSAFQVLPKTFRITSSRCSSTLPQRCCR